MKAALYFLWGFVTGMTLWGAVALPAGTSLFGYFCLVLTLMSGAIVTGVVIRWIAHNWEHIQ